LERGSCSRSSSGARSLRPRRLSRNVRVLASCPSGRVPSGSELLPRTDSEPPTQPILSRFSAPTPTLGIYSALSASPLTAFAVPRWLLCRSRSTVTGVPVRQLIRRLRTCEAGAGTVEYALLIAVLALGLVGVLALFRNAVGGLTNRTAVSVSTRAGGAGYGSKAGGVGGGSSGGTVAHMPAAANPDSASAEPDSSSAGSGPTVASVDPAIP
jgi:Flp pilus assembly pilin Flp